MTLARVSAPSSQSPERHEVSSRSVVGTVVPLPVGRLGELRPLLTDPVASCFAEARLFPVPGQADGIGAQGVLAYHRGADVVSAVMLGANLVPIATDEAARYAIAAELIRMGRRCSSIVGPAAEVLPLWELLEPSWGSAREVRPDQPLLAIARSSAVPPDPFVVPVPLHRLADYLPASVAMFVEEVGVDPRLGGMEQLYRQRVGDLLRTRRAFARWDGDRVVFKAELGAVTRRAVQVQGVWVDPAMRGRGLSVTGMASVVQYGLAVAPVVSLYVNSFNAPALGSYMSVGFQQVGTFATVLF